MSDVRVLGLVAGTHVLEDIGMDVPYGVTVTIPAEKAARSKDLHRAIGQKCIFVLPNQGAITVPFGNPQPPPPPPPPPLPSVIVQNDPAILARIQDLESRNAQLQADLAEANASSQAKLDAILSAIQAGALAPKVVHVAGGPAAVARGDVADGDAPQFIPSEIRPKDAEARIEVQKDEAAASSVSDAASALRKIRQSGGQ